MQNNQISDFVKLLVLHNQIRAAERSAKRIMNACNDGELEGEIEQTDKSAGTVKPSMPSMPSTPIVESPVITLHDPVFSNNACVNYAHNSSVDRSYKLYSEEVYLWSKLRELGMFKNAM
uniref:Uncharacterized protein n=1 Tax=Glossina austeni TaxID=7395 RepID=A0A1A9VNQ2_GLOAU